MQEKRMFLKNQCTEPLCIKPWNAGGKGAGQVIGHNHQGTSVATFTGIRIKGL